MEIAYPGLEPDVCKVIKCPLEAGKKYDLKYELPVQDFFPSMSTVMKWSVKDDNDNEILCASANIEIED